MQLLRTSLLPGIFLLCSFQLTTAQENLPDLYYTGNYQEVISLSAGQIASGDTAFNTFYLKALSEAQLGQTQEAILTLQQSLTVHPGERGLSRMLAGQYFDAGDYVKARDGYAGLVQWDSTDVSSWMKLAEIASFRQQFDEAIDALNQVLAIDSINLESLMMMGDILNRHNQKAAYALGNWYIKANNGWKTIPICEQMLTIDTASIKFSKLLGYAYYKTGEPVSAVRFLEYANQLGDSTAFTFKFKGISHYLRLDFSSAIESLSYALKKDSLDAEVHFFLGASMATTTLKREAMYHLERSLELMQPNPSVTSRIYSEQGNIKRLEMEYEAAYTLYSKAWETDTTSPMSLYYMASILDNSLHQSKEALVDYQRFIDALDRLPKPENGNKQGVSIRAIVEDRIITLKEALFFRDEQ